ncbi:hypothetical protein PMAYCL1PPCAC_03938, partial [Pristionchus mayeri]
HMSLRISSISLMPPSNWTGLNGSSLDRDFDRYPLSLLPRKNLPLLSKVCDWTCIAMRRKTKTRSNDTFSIILSKVRGERLGEAWGSKNE